VPSERERRRRWRDSTRAKLWRTERADEIARLRREWSAFEAMDWLCKGAMASDAAATVSRPTERRLLTAARSLFKSEDAERSETRLDRVAWSFKSMAASLLAPVESIGRNGGGNCGRRLEDIFVSC